MKASQRRAVRYALHTVRCPSCNHQRLDIAAIDPLAVICTCGWYGPATATFTDITTRSGHRTRATVTPETEPQR